MASERWGDAHTYVSRGVAFALLSIEGKGRKNGLGHGVG